MLPLYRMKNIKAFLFDLDGVLVDTEDAYTDFWRDIDKRYPTGVDNFALVIKGNTLQRIFECYFPDADVQAEIVALLKQWEASMKYSLFDGVYELLCHLRSAGILMAIVTSSSRRKMETLYDSVPGFADFFDAVVTDGDVSAGKPDPEGYCAAARMLGVAPSDCVVVEDSLAGIEAGRRAGAYVVGVATTNPAELIAPYADTVVNRLDLLINMDVNQ